MVRSTSRHRAPPRAMKRVISYAVAGLPRRRIAFEQRTHAIYAKIQAGDSDFGCRTRSNLTLP